MYDKYSVLYSESEFEFQMPSLLSVCLFECLSACLYKGHFLINLRQKTRTEEKYLSESEHGSIKILDDGFDDNQDEDQVWG